MAAADAPHIYGDLPIRLYGHEITPTDSSSRLCYVPMVSDCTFFAGWFSVGALLLRCYLYL